MPNSSQLLSSASTCLRESSSAIKRAVRRAVGRDVVVGGRQGLVGTADLPIGKTQTVEGLRRGHLVDQVQVDVDQVAVDLVRLQIFSKRLFGIGPPSPASARRRPPRSAGHRSSPLFSKWCGRSASKVTLSPLTELVPPAVDEELRGPVHHHRGLATAGLVHRRVVGRAGRRPRAPGCEPRRRRAGRAAAGSAPRACGRAGAACGLPGADDHDVRGPHPASAAATRSGRARRRSSPRSPASGSCLPARPGRASAR